MTSHLPRAPALGERNSVSDTRIANDESHCASLHVRARCSPCCARMCRLMHECAGSLCSANSLPARGKIINSAEYKYRCLGLQHTRRRKRCDQLGYWGWYGARSSGAKSLPKRRRLPTMAEQLRAPSRVAPALRIRPAGALREGPPGCTQVPAVPIAVTRERPDRSQVAPEKQTRLLHRPTSRATLPFRAMAISRSPAATALPTASPVRSAAGAAKSAATVTS